MSLHQPSCRLLPIAVLLSGAAVLAGCVGTERAAIAPLPLAAEPVVDPAIAAMYSPRDDGGFHIPGVAPQNIRPENVRRVVDYATDEPPGTIVVDPYGRYLYLVMENGQALRYRVGVGKEGFAFTGTGVIERKAEWPRWTPTQNMIRREPERYGPHAGGVQGGPGNPLGARALYLFRGGRDTLYRIHGTNEDWSIGQAVSSGCIRMLNHDVIDLHNRVADDTRVVVLGPHDVTV